MKPLRAMLICSGLCLGLAAAAVAVPPVIDRVPENAAVVIAVPSPDQLHKSLSDLATAIEFPFPIPDIADLLIMGGVAGGVDTTRSFALVTLAKKPEAKAADHKDDKAKSDKAKPAKPDGADKPAGADKDADKDKDADNNADEDPAAQEDVIALIPVNDFAALLDNFGAKPAEGIIEVQMPSGEKGFIKDLGGGFAAASAKKELLEAYKPAAPGTFTKMMGKAGEAVADSSCLMALVNVKAAKEMGEKGMEKLKEQIADRVPVPGVADVGDNPLARWIGETIERDAKFIVAGVNAGAMGLTVDTAVAFNEGSYLSRVFANSANSAPMLSRLPSQPYLLAWATDSSTPGFKELVKDINEKTKAAGGEQGPASLVSSMTRGDGGAGFIGFNPAIAIGGGVFSNALIFTHSPTPATAAAEFKDSLAAANGKTFEGVTWQTTYKEAGAKVGETPVNVWEMKMKAEPGDTMDNRMQVFLFGPSGSPAGYVAKTDTGVLYTMSKNSALMSAALAAPRGENLGSDKLLAQVSGQLPKNRFMEAYLGTKSILDLVTPLAAMAGATIDPEKIPENLPPIGLAMAPQDGAMHMSVFFPAPVLKTAASIATGLLGDMDVPDMGPDSAPAKSKNPPKGPTGQPRF